MIEDRYIELLKRQVELPGLFQSLKSIFTEKEFFWKTIRFQTKSELEKVFFFF